MCKINTAWKYVDITSDVQSINKVGEEVRFISEFLEYEIGK
jgi:hypothetical protein